jgi:hypothetical protein
MATPPLKFTTALLTNPRQPPPHRCGWPITIGDDTMSRFYASISGSAKTEATRQGTPKSGIVGHVRGWDVGVKVRAVVGRDGQDEIRVYLTGGSNHPNRDRLIGEFTAQDIA